MSINAKKVAVLATNGFEDSELISPWEALVQAGAVPTMVSPNPDVITGKNGHAQTVDMLVREAKALDFDALVLPGGVVNADDLRMDHDAVAFARGFFVEHKPVGVICHGAWILADADVLGGRTLTSYPSLRTDLTNAGATWVDQEVVVDNGLVSSRTPDDLPAFNDALVEEIGEGQHRGQTT
ncbi:type 1 glutamine amidotransferase domain-containing protein [Paramicrobacterium chengjingii]|uniref:Type 1 glutamine amidotransferase n=1 Tax=Paramicrobacterium chengjingii TaxID=2769067 RepID=A0ABX6YJV0_9MICO|nr:type 1 glutamine amidotransferase domain-containing protein [Microbacterium chengjingii]QPZ39021.1 type 1 glutamine amidotransferase [Microbacterium chengjingii]